MDMWDFFVKITRPDGTERELPYGSWNQELAQRLLDASCTFELPEIPEGSLTPWYGGENIRKPEKPKKRSNSLSELSDSEIVEILSDLDEEFTEKETDAANYVESYFGKFKYLTDKSRSIAERLVKKYGNL